MNINLGGHRMLITDLSLMEKLLTLMSLEIPSQNLSKQFYFHCVKSVRIRSNSGLYFPAFGLNTERYFCYKDTK